MSDFGHGHRGGDEQVHRPFQPPGTNELVGGLAGGGPEGPDEVKRRQSGLPRQPLNRQRLCEVSIDVRS